MSREQVIEDLKSEVIELMGKVQLIENEKIKELQMKNKELVERMDHLETKKSERFVTVKELAEIMCCTSNTVHTKIKNGEIFATRKVGDHRIPMSQFYQKEPIDLLKRKTNRMHQISEKDEMKAAIFGNRI